MANTSKRGFASMDPNKQKEIASKGGRAAHAKGTAHEFTSDEARVAGRKGGETVSRDRQHMSAIGREGGHSRGARARAAATNTPSVGGDFERQVTTERSGFERSGQQIDRPLSSQGNNSNNDRGLDRDRERSSYAAPDRGGNSRNERSGDNASSHAPFSGRENI
jgi:general stress protein YciG